MISCHAMPCHAYRCCDNQHRSVRAIPVYSYTVPFWLILHRMLMPFWSPIVGLLMYRIVSGIEGIGLRSVSYRFCDKHESVWCRFSVLLGPPKRGGGLVNLRLLFSSMSLLYKYAFLFGTVVCNIV